MGNAVFPAALLVRHPPSLSFEEAACVECSILTATAGLVDIGGLHRGDFVPLRGIRQCRLAAIQIANMVGAYGSRHPGHLRSGNACWRRARRMSSPPWRRTCKRS